MPIFLAPTLDLPYVPRRHSTPGLGYREPLASGEQGTAQTIALMRKLVDQALNDENFVRKAIEIVRAVPAFDDEGEVRAIFDWIKRNIRYTKDPTTKEKLVPPAELLKLRAGDCDDLVDLTCALAMALGYPCRAVTISTVPDNPSEFTHVYAQVETPPGSNNWIAVDVARVDSQFGLEPQIYFRKRVWDMASNRYEDLAGNKPRKFLSGYVGLGQDDGSSINWQPIVQQSIAEIPTITAAITGSGAASSPYGAYRATSPYSSFLTPYSPGAGIPQAGYQVSPYGTTGVSTASVTLDPMMLLLLGGAILLFATRS